MRLIDADVFEARIAADLEEYRAWIQKQKEEIRNGADKPLIRASYIVAMKKVLCYLRNAETVADRMETNLFDGEEIHENCTVQILTNSVTGETSVGWWENGKA